MRTLSDLRAPDGPPFTVAEACALLGFHRNTLKADISLGHLRAYRRGGRGNWRITHAALRAYALQLGALPSHNSAQLRTT